MYIDMYIRECTTPMKQPVYLESKSVFSCGSGTWEVQRKTLVDWAV